MRLRPPVAGHERSAPRSTNGARDVRRVPAWLTALAALLWLGAAPGARAAPESTPSIAPPARAWPSGTEVLRFENLDGIILLDARLTGTVHDTLGPMVLDTGAGYPALDAPLACLLGVADAPAGSQDEVALAARPLPRLELGARQFDALSPLLTIDAGIVRRVTDRPVLGLLGQSLFSASALWVDFASGTIAIVPVPSGSAPNASWKHRVRDSRAALGGAIAEGAVAVPFVLAGDGKVIVEVRLADPTPERRSRALALALDTGASKSVLFESELAPAVKHAAAWPALHGLSAPTLFGSAEARVARIPELELPRATSRVRRQGLDVAVIGGDLGQRLSRATGITVHGLLGYSFLKHYRACIDYPHRVLWLEAHVPDWEDRPFEFSQPGIQIERDGAAVRIVAVVTGSPAAEAGIAPGDELISLDGASASSLDIVAMAKRLEGAPGTLTSLTIRRGADERTYRLTRRLLL